MCSALGPGVKRAAGCRGERTLPGDPLGMLWASPLGLGWKIQQLPGWGRGEKGGEKKLIPFRWRNGFNGRLRGLRE